MSTVTRDTKELTTWDCLMQVNKDFLELVRNLVLPVVIVKGAETLDYGHTFRPDIQLPAVLSVYVFGLVIGILAVIYFCYTVHSFLLKTHLRKFAFLAPGSMTLLFIFLGLMWLTTIRIGVSEHEHARQAATGQVPPQR